MKNNSGQATVAAFGFRRGAPGLAEGSAQFGLVSCSRRRPNGLLVSTGIHFGRLGHSIFTAAQRIATEMKTPIQSAFGSAGTPLFDMALGGSAREQRNRGDDSMSRPFIAHLPLIPGREWLHDHPGRLCADAVLGIIRVPGGSAQGRGGGHDMSRAKRK